MNVKDLNLISTVFFFTTLAIGTLTQLVLDTDATSFVFTMQFYVILFYLYIVRFLEIDPNKENNKLIFINAILFILNLSSFIFYCIVGFVWGILFATFVCLKNVYLFYIIKNKERSEFNYEEI